MFARPPRIIRLALSLACAVASVGPPAHAQSSAAPDLLKSQGLTRVKGRYILAADEEATFRANREASAAFKAADAAIEEAAAAGARNESIAAFRQRIAFGRSLVDEAEFAMQDGKTLAEQETHREARNGLAADRKNRAAAGLVRERPKPRVQKQLEEKAEAASSEAEARHAELSRKIGELAARYRELATDPDIRAAAGNAKVGPSDRFDRLARSWNESTKVSKKPGARPSASPGERPKGSAEAIEELAKALETLRGLPFKKASPEYENRVRRRDETVGLVESAIGNLKRGESASDLVARAAQLHDGYTLTNRMAPAIRERIEEVRGSFARVSTLLLAE